jgi:hypothetical protein
MKYFLTRLGVFLLIFGLSAEVCFRWVLPARETPRLIQNETFGFFQYDPTGPRDGRFTSGRRAEQRSAWHINAQGWNSPRDFQTDDLRKQPLLVVTGDSQMEGFYVDPQAHFIRRLSQRTKNSVGYSLSASGFKLGEYIAVARYLAHENINPDVMVLFINRGDFWRGVTNLGGKEGFVPRIRIHEDGRGELTQFRDYVPNRARRAFGISATARYLVLNAGLNPFAQGPADLAMNAKLRDPESDAAKNLTYAQAFTFLVGTIRSHLPSTRLMFLVDADRQAIVSGRPVRSLATNAVIAAGCAKLGCAHLDLTQTFVTAWKTDREPFHFHHDVHWNAYTHDLAAQAVYDRLRRLQWLER